MSYRYHHLGVPTTEIHDDEVIYEDKKFASTPIKDNPYRIQWHRFLEGHTFPEILTKLAHVAFQVENLEHEIEGKKILFGPYEPLKGYRVAMIEFKGVPIELVETELTLSELQEMTCKNTSN